MKISNVLILLAAVVAGLFVVPRYIVGTQAAKAEKSPLTPERLARVLQLLDEELARGNAACILEGPFPFDPEKARRRCDRCEDLERAGLIRKTVQEREENGELKFTRRFELTDAGAAYYSEPPDPRGLRGPRFCFGYPKLHHVEAMQEVRLPNFPGMDGYRVRYVVELKDAAPLLFDPRAQSLKLSLPPLGDYATPVLYEQTTDVVNSYGEMTIAW